MPITGFLEGFGDFSELGLVDEALAVGDFFDAADFDTSAFLDDPDVLAGIIHRAESAGVQPGRTTVEQVDFELALLQVGVQHRGDFDLAAGAGLDVLGDLDHVVVAEV